MWGELGRSCARTPPECKFFRFPPERRDAMRESLAKWHPNPSEAVIGGPFLPQAAAVDLP
jgi:hypothetical protein